MECTSETAQRSARAVEEVAAETFQERRPPSLIVIVERPKLGSVFPDMRANLFGVALALVAPAECAESSTREKTPAGRGSDRSLTDVAVASDGETWVTIRDLKWQPGSGLWAENPGKYLGTKLWRLPPGDYEVLAKRKGFKDVRRVIHARPRSTRVHVAAVCEASL